MSAARDETLYAVGHSNHTLEQFLDLVRSAGVEALVDVRSHPHSRFAPQFNREHLAIAVGAADIKYVFLGRELGGRPDGDEYYDDEGHVLYGRVARSALFGDGINVSSTAFTPIEWR